MKQLLKNFLLTVAVLVGIATIYGTMHLSESTEPARVDIGTLAASVQAGEIKSLLVEGNVIHIVRTDDTRQEARKEFTQPLTELLTDFGVSTEQLAAIEEIGVKEPSTTKTVLTNIGPYLFPLLIFGALIFFMTRQVQGANSKAMGFGQSSARQADQADKNKKTFADVAGAHEAKEELEEIVDFLKNPKRFTEMGAKIPKGVLLMGSPGTGKTLLAKAVAGEAGVPFFHMSGSEFVEMFVGVGASRVRDLFQKAKKAAPAIVFIDEIDAVGRKRGAGLGGSHDEREQTLNQILVEMDGFDPHIGVIVVAATNRPDVLDQALMRPGRFDRQVVISVPDIKEREEILEVHAKNKPIASSVSLKRLAERTPGFAGADLENLLNEAAIRAVRMNRKEILEEDILESIEKVLMGPQKKSRIMTEKDKEMTAYHEAGHAVIGHFLTHSDPVRKVSIIGRGMAGGYTMSMPEKDVHYKTKAKFLDDMAMMMGGYVAEKIVYGDDMLTTGPSSDLKKATQVATSMVMKYGMSTDLGPRQFGENEEMIFLAQEIHSKKNYSEKTAEQIDGEISRILAGAEARAREIFTKHRPQVDALVKRLLEIETVEEDEFRSIMEAAV